MKNFRTKIHSYLIAYETKEIEEFNKSYYDLSKINEINEDDVNIYLYVDVLFNRLFRLFICLFLYQNFPYSHVLLLFLSPLSLPPLFDLCLSYISINFCTLFSSVILFFLFLLLSISNIILFNLVMITVSVFFLVSPLFFYNPTASISFFVTHLLFFAHGCY